MRYFIALIAVFFSVSSAFAEITFSNPRVNKRPVDWCLFPTKQCGKAAADRFCDIAHSGTAVRFRGERSSEPTLILGTRQLCDRSKFDHCDRFSVIVCSATRFD
jgi:hypothetical protein